MAKKEHSEIDDPDLARLRAKTVQGALNVLDALLEDPNFQMRLRRVMLRETVKSALFMALFIVGLFMLFGVAKTVYGFSWVVDLATSVTLLIVGLLYMLKKTR